MNESHFFFFLLYICDLHNLKIESKLRIMGRPKMRGAEKANLARLEAIAGMEMRVVTPDMPGYIPNMSTTLTKKATSHSNSAPSSDGASEVKLFYQTSAESNLFCLLCHHNFKNFGPLINHLRKSHGKTLTLRCEKCATTFEDGKAYGLHLARKTDCSKLKKK